MGGCFYVKLMFLHTIVTGIPQGIKVWFRKFSKNKYQRASNSYQTISRTKHYGYQKYNSSSNQTERFYLRKRKVAQLCPPLVNSVRFPVPPRI